MRYSFLFLFFFYFSNYKIYQKTVLSDIKLELSYDIENRCRNNLAIQNISNDTIQYSVKIWRGNNWYFKHKLKLSPGDVKWYDDAFVTCDNYSEILVELIKLE